jgi:hypothetical protein
VIGVREEDGVAVAGRFRGELRADVAAGARAVVDDDLLPQHLRHPLSEDARDRVRIAAGGARDDHADRLRGIRLRDRGRRCDAREHDRCSDQAMAGHVFIAGVRERVQRSAVIPDHVRAIARRE